MGNVVGFFDAFFLLSKKVEVMEFINLIMSTSAISNGSWE
jgi:hypothetical protein